MSFSACPSHSHQGDSPTPTTARDSAPKVRHRWTPEQRRARQFNRTKAFPSVFRDLLITQVDGATHALQWQQIVHPGQYSAEHYAARIRRMMGGYCISTGQTHADTDAA